MRRSTRSELRKLRELAWYFCITKKCCFCKKPLLEAPEGGLQFGARDLPPVKVRLAIHHRDGDRGNNHHGNLKPAHSKCHKSFHAKERAKTRRNTNSNQIRLRSITVKKVKVEEEVISKKSQKIVKVAKADPKSKPVKASKPSKAVKKAKGDWKKYREDTNRGICFAELLAKGKAMVSTLKKLCHGANVMPALYMIHKEGKGVRHPYNVFPSKKTHGLWLLKKA